MEKALLKIARQLCAYDEASLMALWEKYAEITREFEPSKRWEEAVMVLGLIQCLRWKNQLFNYHWSQSRTGGEGPVPPHAPFAAAGPAASAEPEFRREPETALAESGDSVAPAPVRRGKVIPLRRRDEI